MIAVEGIKVAEDITFRESQSDALSDVGRIHSSNKGQANGSGLDRVEVTSTITPIRLKEDTRKVSTAETAIKRSLVTVCEDSGTTAGNQNQWRQ